MAWVCTYTTFIRFIVRCCWASFAKPYGPVPFIHFLALLWKHHCAPSDARSNGKTRKETHKCTNRGTFSHFAAQSRSLIGLQSRRELRAERSITPSIVVAQDGDGSCGSRACRVSQCRTDSFPRRSYVSSPFSSSCALLSSTAPSGRTDIFLHRIFLLAHSRWRSF